MDVDIPKLFEFFKSNERIQSYPQWGWREFYAALFDITESATAEFGITESATVEFVITESAIPEFSIMCGCRES